MTTTMTTTSTREHHPRTVDEESWLTATIRPVGTYGRDDADRLRQLLDALSACASLVVLDLQAARVRSARTAMVIDEAAADIERRGGCLLCVNVDDESRACLAAVGDHAILAGPVGSAAPYAVPAHVLHTELR
jgi:hypothetical protein